MNSIDRKYGLGTTALMRDVLEQALRENSELGENLRDWLKKKWVRITASGDIGGPCGTSKKQSNPDRCLPQAKANSMTKPQRAATARKKKQGGSKGKQFVSNTKKGKVTSEAIVGEDIKCDNCGWQWAIKDGGSDLYICHKCGHDNTPVSEGLWANINAKKKAGKKSSHKNSNAYKAAKKSGDALEKTKEGITKEDIKNLVIGTIAEMQQNEQILQEDDRCTRLAKSKYDTWPSAYASGAVVRCRRGEIWKKK